MMDIKSDENLESGKESPKKGQHEESMRLTNKLKVDLQHLDTSKATNVVPAGNHPDESSVQKRLQQEQGLQSLEELIRIA